MNITRLFFHLMLLVFSGSITAQEISITFQVNMQYQVEQNLFNPNLDFVDIAGSFNGWGSTLTRLNDPDNDQIYDVTVNGFSLGQSIEFKFRKNGRWDGTEEFPGGGNNRIHTIQAGDNQLLFWYNNEASPNGPPVANFQNEGFNIYQKGVVWFEDQSSGQIENYFWEFPGGVPSSSTEQNPIVQYPTPGQYDVSLSVSGAQGSDLVTKSQLIKVAERDESLVNWWNESVFYEIFVRSFYDSDGNGIGDFRGIIEKLDYLNDGDPRTTNDLGITGIWLMPIHDSPTYHGYDAIDYRSVNPDYGSMEDFKAFLEAAHERGIKVIIDYVMNHSSTENPWFKNSASGPNAEKRNWYRWTEDFPGYTGPWGQQVWHKQANNYYYGLFWGGMPDLNYDEPAVKDTMFDIARFWIEEVGVDGFRLDAVKYIFEEGRVLEDTEMTFHFFEEFRDYYKDVNPNSMTVGEAWTSTDKVRQYVEQERIDFCFDFDLSGNIINALNSGNTSSLRGQLQKVYNVYPHLQFGTFLTNHDQNRIMNVFGFEDRKVKAAAAIYLTTPGIPFVYYGEEIGMSGEKPDEFIRLPMQWSSSSNAGFTTGSPWINVNSNFRAFNVASQENSTGSLLSWYKKLINKRNQEKGLQLGDLYVANSNRESILAYTRSYFDQRFLVLVNVSPQDVNDFSVEVPFFELSEGTYVTVDLISEENENISISAEKIIGNLQLAPYEVKILKFTPAMVTNTTQAELDKWQLSLFPNPVVDIINIDHDGTRIGQLIDYTITNIEGKIVRRGQLDFSSSRLQIDVNQLAAGNYSLNCNSKSFKQSFKFLKLD